MKRRKMNKDHLLENEEKGLNKVKSYVQIGWENGGLCYIYYVS